MCCGQQCDKRDVIGYIRTSSLDPQVKAGQGSISKAIGCQVPRHTNQIHPLTEVGRISDQIITTPYYAAE
jgi:hypothetical protein